MIRQRKTGSITVSRPARHRSQNEKTLRTSNPRRRSIKVIHVTLGLGWGASQIAKHPVSHLENNVPFIHQGQHPLQQVSSHSKKSLIQKNDSTKTSFLTRTSRVTHHDDMGSINQDTINSSFSQITSKNISTEKKQRFDQMGLTNDYHRERKEKKSCKCSRRCFIVSLILTLLIIAITVSITLALLLKPPTKTTTPATSTPVLRWNPAGITVAGVTSSLGSGNSQLNGPADVILDWASNLYVADAGNNRIQKYVRDSLTGTMVAGNGTIGFSASQLCNPTRVLVDSNENLYISDSCNSRVQYWNKGARNGTTIAGITGFRGNTSNQLNTAYGIAVHPTSGVLYIADSGNHRIMSYSPGATNGTRIFGDQGSGINNTQLSFPVGLYYDSLSNSLLITNFDAHNVVRYVFGASAWTLAAGSITGIFGVDSMSFNGPTAVVLDPMGNMYVTDASNCRIQFFAPGRMNGTTIAGISGVFGSNATTLFGPYSMALDNQLNLYVADTFNHRIQKFLRY